MKIPIEERDLTEQAPQSPRVRYGGFAILGRTVDKCRASIAGTLGEYHYDCPLDNQLFSFKGVTGDEFKAAVVQARNYEDVANWLEENGTARTPEEIRAWSDQAEAARLKDVFKEDGKAEGHGVMESCERLGIDFETGTLFEWLEADDLASFEPHAHMARK